MCELFAMSARLPATVNFSLEEFARHGGATDLHRDGWGIAFYEDRDVFIMREPQPAVRSAALRFIRTHNYRSRLVIAHIRYATVGGTRLANTQPFARELGGSMHVFAHNGNLAGVHDVLGMASSSPYRPVGDTDSEYAFCVLMGRMRELWRDGPPGLDAQLAVLEPFADVLRAMGPANFIYSDGRTLFFHGHERNRGDGTFGPPGLHFLQRQCVVPPSSVAMAGLSLRSEEAQQQVILLASVPLSDERWSPLAEGELVAIRDGALVARRIPAARGVRGAAGT